MPQLPTYVTTHATDTELIVRTIVKLETSTPFKWTDYDVPIDYGGDTYSPRGALRVSGLGASAGLSYSATLIVGDGDGAIVAADLTGGGVKGKRITIRDAWMTAPNTVQAVVTRFRGYVDRPEYTDASAALQLIGIKNLDAVPLPSYSLGPTCTHRFKGPDGRCGYAGGDTTCLHTFADCTSKSNTDRFGGLRNIPGPSTRIIWGTGGFRLG